MLVWLLFVSVFVCSVVVDISDRLRPSGHVILNLTTRLLGSWWSLWWKCWRLVKSRWNWGLCWNVACLVNSCSQSDLFCDRQLLSLSIVVWLLSFGGIIINELWWFNIEDGPNEVGISFQVFLTSSKKSWYPHGWIGIGKVDGEWNWYNVGYIEFFAVVVF